MGLFGSRWLETVTQYGYVDPGTGLQAAADNNLLTERIEYVDSTNPWPGGNPNTETFAAEARFVREKASRPPGDVIVVIVRPSSEQAPLAAKHGVASRPGDPVADTLFIDLPYDATHLGQLRADLHRQLANTLTDPFNDGSGPRGWARTLDGGVSCEIADLCPGTVIVRTGPRSQLPNSFVGELWSNAADGGGGACVSSRATSASAIVRANDTPDTLVQQASHIEGTANPKPTWGIPRSWDPPDGSGGAPLPSFVGDPTATSWGPDRIDTFVRGDDGNLWHSATQDNGNSVAWDNWGGAGAGYQWVYSPDATSWGPGRLDLFATRSESSEGTLGADVHIVWASFDETTASLRYPIEISHPKGWIPASGVSGMSWASTRRTTASQLPKKRLDVFVLGNDGKIHHGWTDDGDGDGERWSWIDKTGIDGWSPEAGTAFVGGPDATGWGDGRTDLFIRNDRGELLHAFVDEATNEPLVHVKWESWGQPVGQSCAGSGCPFTSDPSVANLGEGRLVVAGRAAASINGPQHIWQRVWDFGAGDWIDTGGNPASGPAVTAW